MEALGLNLPKLIYQIINFLMLMIILYALLYKRVLAMLAERQQRIEQSLKDAEQVKLQLANAKRDYDAEIAKARQEAASIVAQAQERAKSQEVEILAQARRDADKVREEARASAIQERDTLLREAKDQIAQLITITAGQVLGAELKASGHDKLIAESLSALDRRN